MTHQTIRRKPVSYIARKSVPSQVQMEPIIPALTNESDTLPTKTNTLPTGNIALNLKIGTSIPKSNIATTDCDTLTTNTTESNTLGAEGSNTPDSIKSSTPSNNLKPLKRSWKVWVTCLLRRRKASTAEQMSNTAGAPETGRAANRPAISSIEEDTSEDDASSQSFRLKYPYIAFKDSSVLGFHNAKLAKQARQVVTDLHKARVQHSGVLKQEEERKEWIREFEHCLRRHQADCLTCGAYAVW
jgi:hypothetical protein